MGKLSLARMARQRPDPPRLALLLRDARVELGLNQRELAKHFQVAPRTVSRWESGDARPTLEWREEVVRVLANIKHETWCAIVKELRIPLSAALELCPAQKAKATPPADERRMELDARPPAQAQLPETAPEPTPMPEASPPATIDHGAALDAVIRAAAEDLDVTARKLRAALGAVLEEMARLGLGTAEGAAIVTKQSAMIMK